MKCDGPQSYIHACFVFLLLPTHFYLESKISPIQFTQIIKFLIIAYAAMLLIQQFCVLLGLPIINISNYSVLSPWKLNSLAMSPHTQCIVCFNVLLLVLHETIKSRGYNFKNDFRKDKWVWIAFIWTMLTLGSGTAFIFLPLVLLKF